MNLWVVFPQSLLEINEILDLPKFAVPFYIYVLYTLFKQPKYRAQLAVFLTLTALTSLLMILTLGPNIGTVVAPVMLFSVMIMPLGTLIVHTIKKRALLAYLSGL